MEKKAIYQEVIKFYKDEKINYKEKLSQVYKVVLPIINSNEVLSKKILYYIGRGSNKTFNSEFGELSIRRFISGKNIYHLIEDFFVIIMSKKYVNLVSKELKKIENFNKVWNEKKLSKNFIVGNGFSIGLDGDYLNNKIVERLSDSDKKILKDLKSKLEKIFSDVNADEEYWLYDNFKNEINTENIDFDKIDDKSFRYLFYRYFQTIKKTSINDIGIEDYFYIFNLLHFKSEKFDGKLFKIETKIKEAFICSILNGNKALDILKNRNIGKYDLEKIKTFFKGENLITTNYDLNLDLLNDSKCYHIHGGFDLWFKKINGFEILLKKRNIDDGIKLLEDGYYPDVILNVEDNKTYDIMSLDFLGIEREQMIQEKLYYIEGLLIVFGFSGLNDNHIVKNIRENHRIEKIIYVYHGKMSVRDKYLICEKFSLYDKSFYFINSEIIWRSFEKNS